MNAVASDHSFSEELTAIGALLDDVRKRRGHLENDTVSALSETVQQLQATLAAALALQDRLRSPFAWIPEPGTNCDLQPRLTALAARQVEIRLLLDRMRSLWSRYPSSQRLSPVLRVALWNVRSLACRLERHLDKANRRLLSSVRAFNASARKA